MIDQALFQQRALNSMRRTIAESFVHLTRVPVTTTADIKAQEELHTWLVDLDNAVNDSTS